MAHRKELPANTSVAQMGDGARMHAPAAERNAGAILKVLMEHASAQGQALEIASGTGQHVTQLARALPGLTWQPTDVDPDRLASINAWAEDAPNIRPARALDATTPSWHADHSGQDVILLVNLLHLISEAEARVLITETSQALSHGGRVFLYGPFLRDDRPTSDGDARFDASLRAADPAIGYKDLGDVTAWLVAAGLRLLTAVDMPANNLILIAERPSEAPG